MCFDNQYVFIPFVFDTFDSLTLKTVDLLHIIERVMHINVMSPKSMHILFI